MNMRFQNRIITASAGTGKTYRLSLEYIAIILKYFEHPDFSLDSILAITFTRKATAEIRQEIIKHLDGLIAGDNPTLIKALGDIFPLSEDGLTDRQKGILSLAKLQILTDQRNLQIMTIDSYTGNIFRNIVRPQRSIDDYDLDENAVNKRMPFLLDHLMKPEFRKRIDSLLSRRVQRNLDSYEDMFAMLIENRWLYFLIKECYVGEKPRSEDVSATFRNCCVALFDELESAREAKARTWESMLKVATRNFFIDPPKSKDELVDAFVAFSRDSYRALKLFGVMKKSPFYDSRPIAKDRKEEAAELHKDLLNALAAVIYNDFLIPEQEEILSVWEIILKEYDSLIYRYKNLTYSDITWLTFETLHSAESELRRNNMMPDNEFYEFLTHRTRFMLIDEFQDTSLLQFKILKPIMEEVCAGIGSKEFGGVIIVGDQKQSIYGWRGGERELLIKLRDIVPPLRNVEPNRLDLSYRSSPDMMDFINRIFTSDALRNYLKSKELRWQYDAVSSALNDSSTNISTTVFGYNRHRGEKYLSYKHFVEDIVLKYIDKKGEDLSCAIICRKTGQLAAIQQLLQEKGVAGVFQPSARITEHRLVSPLYSWLRFVAFHDWIDLLSFLRSDYLLLSAPVLKEVIDAIYHLNSSEPRDIELPEELSFFMNLAAKHKEMSPYHIIREISQLCLRDMDKVAERDLLNLHQFQKIVKSWEMQESEQSLKTTEFLDYLSKNIKDEAFKQVSVEGGTQIQLLTIHKSKGLQFDKVFVYYDLDTSGMHQKDLSWAIDYADDGFEDIRDYVITYHYDSILSHCPKSEIWERKENLALLEELNNLYVAFTRAKTRLHIFFGYPTAKPFDEYLDGKKKDGDINLALSMVEACLESIDGETTALNEDDNPHARFFKSRITSHLVEKKAIDAESIPTEEQSEARTPQRTLITAAPHELNWQEIEDISKPEIASHRELYVEKKSSLRGTIIHDYLSFIKYDLEEEHREAKSFTLRRYGSILSINELNELFATIADEVKKTPAIFSKDYDMVLTEYAIADYRIDRIMVNSKQKKVMVIDFKTGAIDEESDQLDDYIAALKAMPMLDDYTFEQEYVSFMKRD
ncbi:MAG TPA: UvrD-helicase domain-containing protein [Candidatus Cloacimonetes bacterium]|nr:UvrD-helicase domain-containing protein [Candidatus Cloacimonadota bacterium]